MRILTSWFLNGRVRTSVNTRACGLLLTGLLPEISGFSNFMAKYCLIDSVQFC